MNLNKKLWSFLFLSTLLVSACGAELREDERPSEITSIQTDPAESPEEINRRDLPQEGDREQPEELTGHDQPERESNSGESEETEPAP